MEHACATFACERNQTDTNFKYLTLLFEGKKGKRSVLSLILTVLYILYNFPFENQSLMVMLSTLDLGPRLLPFACKCASRKHVLVLSPTGSYNNTQYNTFSQE
jgi:hypothetical protein